MVLHIIYFSWHACSARCGLLFMLNSYFFFFLSFLSFFCKCWLTPCTRLRWDWRLQWHIYIIESKRNVEGNKKLVSSRFFLCFFFVFSTSSKCWLFRRNAYFPCVNEKFHQLQKIVYTMSDVRLYKANSNEDNHFHSDENWQFWWTSFEVCLFRRMPYI